MGIFSSKNMTSAQYLQKYFIGDSYNSPVNPTDREYRFNTLCLAIIQGDLKTVENQFNAGNIDINGTFHCCTPLLYASYAVRKKADNAEEILSLILEQKPNLKEHPGAEIDSLESDGEGEGISTSPLGNILLIKDEAEREKWYARFLELGVSFDHKITYWEKNRYTGTRSLLGFLLFNDKNLFQKTMDHYDNNILQLFENKEVFFEAATYKHFNPIFNEKYDDFLSLCIKHGCPPNWAPKCEAAVAKKRGEMSKEALEKLVHETPSPTFVKNVPFSPYALGRAIRAGDLEDVRAQLEKEDLDINLEDLDCIPPILHASYAARVGTPNAREILLLILEKNPKLDGVKWNKVGGNKMLLLLNSFLESDTQSKRVELSPLGNILEVEDEKLREEMYSHFLEMGIDPTQTLDSYQVETTKSSRKKYCKVDSAKLEEVCLVSRLIDRKDLLEKTLNHFDGKFKDLFKSTEAFMVAFNLITAETCNYESIFSANVEDLVELHRMYDWKAHVKGLRGHEALELSKQQARWDMRVKKWQEVIEDFSSNATTYESIEADSSADLDTSE